MKRRSTRWSLLIALLLGAASACSGEIGAERLAELDERLAALEPYLARDPGGCPEYLGLCDRAINVCQVARADPALAQVCDGIVARCEALSKLHCTRVGHGVRPAADATATDAGADSAAADTGQDGPARRDSGVSVDAPPPRPTYLGGYGYMLDNPKYYGLPFGNGVGQSNINLNGDRQVANRFRAKKTGHIKRAAFNLKVDTARPGYSAGTFGVLEVSIQTINSQGMPSGHKLATVRRSGFKAFSGGNGGGMVVTFPARGAAVTKDTQYAIVWDNVDSNPSANWFALNFFYGNDRSSGCCNYSHSQYNGTVHESVLTDRNSYDMLMYQGGKWTAGGNAAHHTAWFEVIYDDSDTQGLAYLGGVPTQGYPVSRGRSIGQFFTPPSSFESDTLYFSPGYRGVSSATAFRLTVTGGAVNVTANGDMSANNVDDWIEFKFPKTTFKAGTKYTAMFTLTGGSTVTFRLPLAPAHDEWTSSRSGWVNAGVIAPGNPYNGHSSDLSMYFLKRASAVGTASGAITFTRKPTDQTAAVGGTVTLSWVAKSASGLPLRYRIQTQAASGGKWYDFGTQAAAQRSFPALQLADNGTLVKITASNGVDTPAEATAKIFVGSKPPASGGKLSKVYFHGHSLMNQGLRVGWNFSRDTSPGAPGGNIPDYIATAMTSAGLSCHGVFSNPGSSAAGALANIKANRNAWIGADAIVFDYAINGDESAAQFLAYARAINNYVRGQKASMRIFWVEAHASPGGTVGSKAHVQLRWQNKNPMLWLMKSNGEIDAVVPWRQYAAANPQIYQSDGVHHWADQRPYADQIVAALAALASN